MSQSVLCGNKGMLSYISLIGPAWKENSYTEQQGLKKQIEEAFAGTEYSDRTDVIERMICDGASAKVIYLDTLRSFGRKDGLAIYRRLKDCAMLFASGGEPNA